MSSPKINKILVIDDSEDFRKLLIKFFEDVCPGASIDAYDPANGKPSETFVWDKYNLIILDYDLGNGENGLDWLRTFKTSTSFPPTIMLTAQGNEETVVTAFRYGAQDYLKKEGLTKGRMIESLNRALGKYQEDSKKADTQQLSVHLYKKEKFYRSLDNVKIKDIIILVEIDKFHTLRDELGMLSADKTTEFVLEKSLKYLSDSEYTSEITRISDSNIAILIRNYQKDDQGETICKQLCKIMGESRFEVNGKSIDFSLNIASVYVDDDNTKADDILKQADIACRMSRNKPGNTYTISGILSNDKLIASEQLDAHIQNVFNEDRVKPQYQNFITLSSVEDKYDSIEYYQVRINLIDRDNTIIEPREFIPVLKNKNMQKEMDRWVINSCIQKIAANISSKSEKSGFFVSLTDESLEDISFLKWIESVLVMQEISDLENMLVLEISVNNYIKYQKQTSFLIKSLGEKHNILFALTELTENSTLKNYLSQSRFNFIMMSPYLNDARIPENEITNIVKTGREFSCFSVANKIENNDAMLAAMTSEFDLISGYFLQPPQENILETEIVEV